MQAERKAAPAAAATAVVPKPAVDTRGKHRISAELKRLEQEARFLEVILLFFGFPLFSLNFFFFFGVFDLC